MRCTLLIAAAVAALVASGAAGAQRGKAPEADKAKQAEQAAELEKALLKTMESLAKAQEALLKTKESLAKAQEEAKKALEEKAKQLQEAQSEVDQWKSWVVANATAANDANNKLIGLGKATREAEADAPFRRNETVPLLLLNRTVEFASSMMPGPLLSPVALGCLAAVLGVFACCVGCLAGYCWRDEGCSLPDPRAAAALALRGYEPVRAGLKDFLKAELSLAILAPWATAAAALVLRLAPLGGPAAQAVQLAVAGLLVARASLLDWRFWGLARGHAEGGSCRACSAALLFKEFLLSKLELLDAASDGLALAVGCAAGERTRRRWAASFALPARARSALAAAGPGPALAAALAYASFVQWGFAVSGPDTFGNALRARLAGLGLAAAAAEAEEPDEDKKSFGAAVLLALAHAFAECGPQLLLQTALLAAEGEGLVAQPTVALSVAATAAMLVKGAAGLAAWGLPRARAAWRDGEGVEAAVFLGLIGVLAAFLVAFAALALLRVAGVEACESRTWTLSGGCLPPSALAA